jgi:transketolase
MPGMIVLRPADANEVVEAWRVIMDIKDRPVSLVLTRQALPTVDRTKYTPANGVARGAYVLADAPDHAPDVLLLATGSEVSLCITAYEQLTSDGIKARVAVEEASTFGWERYAGVSGTMLGLHTFGLSAPMKVVAPHFGCDSAHVVAAAREQGARHAAGRRTSGAGGI